MGWCEVAEQAAGESQAIGSPSAFVWSMEGGGSKVT